MSLLQLIETAGAELGRRVGVRAALVANALTQGVLCAAVTVWGNQIVKQAGRAKEGKP